MWLKRGKRGKNTSFHDISEVCPKLVKPVITSWGWGYTSMGTLSPPDVQDGVTKQHRPGLAGCHANRQVLTLLFFTSCCCSSVIVLNCNTGNIRSQSVIVNILPLTLWSSQRWPVFSGGWSQLVHHTPPPAWLHAWLCSPGGGSRYSTWTSLTIQSIIILLTNIHGSTMFNYSSSLFAGSFVHFLDWQPIWLIL